MRVAVVAGGDPGHVFPAAALAVALKRRGHTPLLVTGARWLAALHRDGIPAIALPELPAGALPDPPTGTLPDPPAGSSHSFDRSADPSRDQSAGPSRDQSGPEPGASQTGDPFDRVLRWRRTSRRMAAPLADSLTGFGPEVVVSDVLTPSGWFAAGLLGVPWVQLVPHPLQDPSPHLPPSGSGLRPARGPLGRARDRWLYGVTSRQWQQGAEADDAERARLGLPPGEGPLGRIVASLPALEAHRPDWPADAHLVGPLEWDPADADLDTPPGEGPLVVLSATTVPGATCGLPEATLQGLAGTGVRVAWTLLGPPRHTLPGWVTAGPGRQGPLIGSADALVCGGGHGILAKALVRGRPVVAVPGGGEQRENTDRLHRHGLGISIPPARLSPARLRAAVLRVLHDPSFGRRAARCVPAPGAPSAGDRAVDVLERLVDSGYRPSR